MVFFRMSEDWENSCYFMGIAGTGISTCLREYHNSNVLIGNETKSDEISLSDDDAINDDAIIPDDDDIPPLLDCEDLE